MSLSRATDRANAMGHALANIGGGLSQRGCGNLGPRWRRPADGQATNLSYHRTDAAHSPLALEKVLMSKVLIAPATLAGVDGLYLKLLREAGFDVAFPA